MFDFNRMYVTSYDIADQCFSRVPARFSLLVFNENVSLGLIAHCLFVL